MNRNNNSPIENKLPGKLGTSLAKLKNFGKLLASAGKSFVRDDAIKLSASLSYYTVFALGPVLLLIISIAGIFYGEAALQGKLFSQIKDLVGSSAADVGVAGSDVLCPPHANKGNTNKTSNRLIIDR